MFAQEGEYEVVHFASLEFAYKPGFPTSVV
jgi:hypothetical protein